MRLVPGSERIVADAAADPLAGRVRWAPAKSLWIGAMSLTALIAGPLTITPGAFALFVATTALTLCAGHSLGLHRRLIHASFDCPRWLERLLVYLGTLVGMAGPIGMIRTHDMRDWAQRQPACHPYFGHRARLWRDGWHQLQCELLLDHPPAFRLEPRIAGDLFYAWLERHWMAQQLPWAALFLAIGGVPWLVWGGVCAGRGRCHRPLAGRPFRPSPRRPELDRRGRGAPPPVRIRLRRTGCRPRSLRPRKG